MAQLTGRAEYEALEPGRRLALCAFDNVCSCIRRSVWEHHPFQSTSIGEDVAWAQTVLFAGARLVFSPKAAVVHSHDRSVSYEFTRTPQSSSPGCSGLFELQTIPTAGLLLRGELGARSGCIYVWNERVRCGCRARSGWPLSGRADSIWALEMVPSSSTRSARDRRREGRDAVRVLTVVHGFPPHAQGWK